MKAQETFEILEELQRDIKQTLSRIKVAKIKGDDDYLDVIDFDRSPDGYLQEELLYDIFYKLISVSDNLDYIKLPIKEEGLLTKNHNNEFELNGFVLRPGSSLEIYVYSKEVEQYVWSKTSVRSTGNRRKYVLSGYRDISLDHLKARIRV